MTPVASEPPQYRVNVVCKANVMPFPPSVEPFAYPHDDAFRDFLLRKRRPRATHRQC